MADFCLLPRDVAKLRESFERGDLSAESLAAMTSAERHTAFAELVGEGNAQRVNASFESKLLLKHQQEALGRWVEAAGKLAPDVKRDMLSKVQRLDRVLSEKEETAFLTDLARQRLGFGVTMEEAGKVTELAKAVQDAREANDWKGYLDARIAFREYVGARSHPPLSGPEKAAAYVRAGALTWPTTLVKLTAVALSRMFTTPLEDFAALGIAKALPRLSEGAGRYATTSASVAARAEAAAVTAQFTDGMIDAWRLLRNKASRLDLAFDDNATAHRWFEYSGSLHGALKEPIKRAEFTRSLFRRTEAAVTAGDDVSDMTVRMRLATEAFKDSQRAISMQDNAITGAWNSGLQRLNRVDKVTGKKSPLGVFLSTVLKADTPVMKAPTNNILEAGDYIAGLPLGGWRAAWEYAHGIEGLKPVERDAIIRQMAKGSIGAAVMTLYFFKHDKVQFGGFYEPGEKRKPEDVPAGAARVGSTDIPKQLLHNPAFDAAQYAASMARVIEHGKPDQNGVLSATWAASLGLLDELPVMQTAKDAARVVGGGQSSGDAASKEVAGMLVPGVVQWIAKQTDDTKKRYPHGLVEHVEANLPVLRKNVPAEKRKH